MDSDGRATELVQMVQGSGGKREEIDSASSVSDVCILPCGSLPITFDGMVPKGQEVWHGDVRVPRPDALDRHFQAPPCNVGSHPLVRHRIVSDCWALDPVLAGLLCLRGTEAITPKAAQQPILCCARLRAHADGAYVGLDEMRELAAWCCCPPCLAALTV